MDKARHDRADKLRYNMENIMFYLDSKSLGISLPKDRDGAPLINSFIAMQIRRLLKEDLEKQYEQLKRDYEDL